MTMMMSVGSYEMNRWMDGWMDGWMDEIGCLVIPDAWLSIPFVHRCFGNRVGVDAPTHTWKWGAVKRTFFPHSPKDLKYLRGSWR